MPSLRYPVWDTDFKLGIMKPKAEKEPLTPLLLAKEKFVEKTSPWEENFSPFTLARRMSMCRQEEVSSSLLTYFCVPLLVGRPARTCLPHVYSFSSVCKLLTVPLKSQTSGHPSPLLKIAYKSQTLNVSVFGSHSYGTPKYTSHKCWIFLPVMYAW